MSARSLATPRSWRRTGTALLGDGLRPELRPVLGVSLLAATSLVGFSAYAPVWAIKSIGASAQQVGWLLLGGALASTVISYLAGRASDRFGRRPVVVTTLTTHGLAVRALLLVGQRVAVGLPIAAVAWTASAATWPQLAALVADAADATRREAGFAATRVATTVGMTAGPALSILLLIAGGWAALLVGVAALDLSGAAVVAALLRSSAKSSASPRGDAPSLRRLLADRRFVALLLSTFFGFSVFVAFETVLPVVAVSDYALAPAVWGAIFLINPVVAVLLQVRLTERLARRRAAANLAAAMLLTGWPFLLLLTNASLVTIPLVVLLVALGDVLWVPTRQALAIDLAAARSRGAYVGALGAAATLAWAAAPPAAFALGGTTGDHALWLAVACVATVAAVLGLPADRTGHRQVPSIQDRPGVRDLSSPGERRARSALGHEHQADG
jgi:MFS family permease